MVFLFILADWAASAFCCPNCGPPFIPPGFLPSSFLPLFQLAPFVACNLLLQFCQPFTPTTPPLPVTQFSNHLPCSSPFFPQEFHYRPKGSDTCLPCDCYPIGSSSRSCDQEMGQCHCRPGVIGRQCNSCDSPFAEVTPSGCQGEFLPGVF